MAVGAPVDFGTVGVHGVRVVEVVVLMLRGHRDGRGCRSQVVNKVHAAATGHAAYKENTKLENMMQKLKLF